MKHVKLYEQVEIDDPFGEERKTNIKQQYSYEEFCDLANVETLDKFYYEYMKYSGDDGIEDYYYGNIKYWTKFL